MENPVGLELDDIFHPRSIAVAGASWTTAREGLAPENPL